MAKLLQRQSVTEDCRTFPELTANPQILRLVQGLQTSLTHGVATPEGWQPGDKVLVGAPKTVDELQGRLAEGLETTDWYFAKRSLG